MKPPKIKTKEEHKEKMESKREERRKLSKIKYKEIIELEEIDIARRLAKMAKRLSDQ